MSQFNNSIEPNVIDDEMLQKAIEEKCPEDLGDTAREESINVKVVTEIQFSFKNILQINNLWPLENLTKLQLDNNVIEKIEGLESLVHLVWLDLSFNNIEVIEGLDTLVKLQDLSLYKNRISKIEHMDTLQELQIFSIGKNNLTILEDVIYLRRLKSLQTLNLSGNPFCSEEHYRLFVVAHLPSLVYLDFKLVRNSTRKAAALKYQNLTKPLEQEEAEVLALQEAEDAKQRELEYHQAAFVEYLNGSFLFDSLHEEDGEAAKLASLPGVEELLQAFSQCRDLENQHLEKLMEIVKATLKKVDRYELEEDFPDDLRKLFKNKNTVVNIINVSHSIRLRKIDKRESDMLSNIYQWQKSVTEKAFQTESDRNRACIEKIICFINTLQKELDSTVILEPAE
ncbi:dynein regulatory complex subunit 3 isoform X2 [Passer domesticus]|uniref:dynein regulatory complex subunit 3 isoform X2 n=1 Tax=Passer domesticus TaxID=48849 RepID=UPI0030FE1E5A